MTADTQDTAKNFLVLTCVLEHAGKVHTANFRPPTSRCGLLHRSRDILTTGTTGNIITKLCDKMAHQVQHYFGSIPSTYSQLWFREKLHSEHLTNSAKLFACNHANHLLLKNGYMTELWLCPWETSKLPSTLSLKAFAAYNKDWSNGRGKGKRRFVSASLWTQL